MNDQGQELVHTVGYERDNQKHVNLLQQDMRLLRTALQKFEYTARVKLAGLDEKLNSIERRLEYLQATSLTDLTGDNDD
ncbi:hypothetical protein HKI87_11g67020 [Chloropicon roscoffensis]|uniref:Uncharacterized protein n=1 Tax=Chloropicon roscoffensis TaxID=1461544 RepID=A0AAX4PGK7_9CHLO